MASPSTCWLSFPGSFYTKPRLLSSSSSSLPLAFYPLQNPNKLCRKKIERVICRADFSQDAPLASAIGACILSSFVFPVAKRVDDEEEEEEENSAIVSTDMRLAAMGIISFIPYFNWLSWVFAWLDTGKTRYAVYALVYLLPYLSSNLSISPEESWLPITSIVLGIIHVQLEASIANGDVQTLAFFRDTSENFSSKKRIYFDKKHSKDERGKQWRVQAVAVAPDRFENRKALPEQWRRLRDEELSKAAEIPGCVFVHMSGFIGGNHCYDGALSMARTALTL